MLEESKNDVWSGRLFVSLIADEAFGYKNVRFLLFQPEMDKEEIARLLKPFGLSQEDEESRYVGSYVETTFDYEQVLMLEEYFNSWDGVKIEIKDAVCPKGNYMGVGATAVGGGTDF